MSWHPPVEKPQGWFYLWTMNGQTSMAPEHAASATAIAMAKQALLDFRECFWFRHPDAQVSTVGDVKLIIDRLRRHGDRKAWRAAQSLLLCR